MAEVVVNVLLNNLCELIEKEAHRLFSVKPNVESLHEKLKWINVSLKEADNKCQENEQIKFWVAEVREAAFQAEDIIDEFAFQVKKNPILGVFSLRKIGKELKEINLRLDKISENRSNLGIRNVQDGEPSFPIIRKEKRSPRVEEADIVGIEDEAEIISKMLIEGGQQRSVVSIVGMGGLGKTTLANKLFNDIHIRRSFQCYAWIYVFQEFIVRDLLYDLIKCFKTLSSYELKSMNEEELSRELFNCLKGKRYTIVLA